MAEFDSHSQRVANAFYKTPRFKARSLFGIHVMMPLRTDNTHSVLPSPRHKLPMKAQGHGDIQPSAREWPTF
jgi:hypothetical protein